MAPSLTPAQTGDAELCSLSMKHIAAIEIDGARCRGGRHRLEGAW
jgi:hypothetical protein